MCLTKTLSHIGSRPHDATARVFNFDIRIFFRWPLKLSKFSWNFTNCFWTLAIAYVSTHCNRFPSNSPSPNNYNFIFEPSLFFFNFQPQSWFFNLNYKIKYPTPNYEIKYVTPCYCRNRTEHRFELALWLYTWFSYFLKKIKKLVWCSLLKL